MVFHACDLLTITYSESFIWKFISWLARATEFPNCVSTDAVYSTHAVLRFHTTFINVCMYKEDKNRVQKMLHSQSCLEKQCGSIYKKELKISSLILVVSTLRKKYEICLEWTLAFLRTLYIFTGGDILLFFYMLPRITEVVINITNSQKSNTAFKSRVHVEVFHSTEYWKRTWNPAHL